MVFAPRCPICHAPIVWEGNADRPFCSERCRLIDLGGWASERYRVPDQPAPDPDQDPDSGENGESDENGAA